MSVWIKSSALIVESSETSIGPGSGLKPSEWSIATGSPSEASGTASATDSDASNGSGFALEINRVSSSELLVNGSNMGSGAWPKSEFNERSSFERDDSGSWNGAG